MKLLTAIFAFALCVSFSQTQINRDQKESPSGCLGSKFIVIANVGSSDYSVATIIISCDSIEKPIIEKGNFGMHLKYNSYVNYVVDSVMYNKIFTFLNIYQLNRERKEDFIKTEKNILIADFKGKNNKDYELLSLTEISSVILFSRNLHCFLSSNGFDQKIISHVGFMYKALLKYYDRKNETFKSELTCP